MEQRFAVLVEGPNPRIYKVPLNQTARLVNEFPFRNVAIFESLDEAKEAALAIAERAQANAKPPITMFAAKPVSESDQLRQALSELTEERIETYRF